MSQDWKKLLKADPTNWLLDEGDSRVRYLALRDLVEADEKELAAARTRAHREGPIAIILDNMSPEGWWVAPGNVYANKCRGTVWSIISLAELGASIDVDKRVGIACNYLMEQSLLKSGQFEPRMKPNNMGLCLQGNMLLSLMDMGCRDPRLEKAYEWTARRVTGEDVPLRVNPDGLPPGDGAEGPFRYLRYYGPRFICRTNKEMPCGWAGVKVMMAFSRLPVESRSPVIDRAIDVGIDFFLNTELSQAGFPGHRTGVPDPRWWQFRFPSFWGADLLQIAEAFVALGYGADPRLAGTLHVIQTKQDESGKWLLEYVEKSHRMWTRYGTAGRLNKWVTLRAMRVLKNAVEQGYVPGE